MITIEKKSLKVGKYVNTEHVDTVVRNYKQERWVYNSERIGKEDSLSGMVQHRRNGRIHGTCKTIWR